MADPYSYLRTCAACSGFFLTYSSPRDEPFFCTKCHGRRMDGFDPQPGDMVKHVDKQSGPFSRLVVMVRREASVDVQPIGFPGMWATIPISALVPDTAYGRNPR